MRIEIFWFLTIDKDICEDTCNDTCDFIENVLNNKYGWKKFGYDFIQINLKLGTYQDHEIGHLLGKDHVEWSEYNTNLELCNVMSQQTIKQSLDICQPNQFPF